MRGRRFLLALGHIAGKLDDLGRRIGAVDEGALRGEVDEAGGDAFLPYRYLAQHQRAAARRLEHRDQLAQRDCRFIDLVEEQEVRDAAILELLQDDLQRRHAAGIRLAHDHGRIARGQGERPFVLELDRAWAVDEGEIVA